MQARHRQSVLQHNGEVVALPQGQCREPVAHPGHLGIPFGVAETQVDVGDSERVRVALDAGDES